MPNPERSASQEREKSATPEDSLELKKSARSCEPVGVPKKQKRDAQERGDEHTSAGSPQSDNDPLNPELAAFTKDSNQPLGDDHPQR